MKLDYVKLTQGNCGDILYVGQARERGFSLAVSLCEK